MTLGDRLRKAGHDMLRSEGAVERDVDPELPLVMADGFGVSPCLEITNAVKYGRTARWIGIQARTVGG